MDERRAMDAARVACDARLPEWRHSRGRSGSVTIPVDGGAAQDSAGLIADARRAWREVNRPNALIGLNATEDGLAALRELVSLGVCVDVLCREGACQLARLLDAYMEGLAAASSRGLDLGPIRAVATLPECVVDGMVEAAMDDVRMAIWLELQDLGANALMAVPVADRPVFAA